MLTFQQAVEKFATARKGKPCKLAGNTYLEKIDESTYAVKFHATNVVLIHGDGTFTLDNGGYRTNTTKNRINEYSPANVFQQNFEWHLYVRSDSIGTSKFEFVNGMRIEGDGSPINGIPVIKKGKR